MKKLILTTLAMLLLAGAAYAAEDTVTSTTSCTILEIFSIEFFDDTSVRYPNGQIAFPAIDPADEETMIMTDAWTDGDLKSDVGVVCRTNLGLNWALKIKMSTTSTVLQRTNVAVYKPNLVYNRNTDPATTYSTGIIKQWYIMSDTDETIFTGTDGAQNTAPFGILATFSFAVLPTGQAKPSGQDPIGWANVLPKGSHSFDVVYTMTTSL